MLGWTAYLTYGETHKNAGIEYRGKRFRILLCRMYTTFLLKLSENEGLACPTRPRDRGPQ